MKTKKINNLNIIYSVKQIIEGIKKSIIEKILIVKSKHINQFNLKLILNLAKDNNIICEFIKNEKFLKLFCKKDLPLKNQNIIAFCKPIQYLDISKYLSKIDHKYEKSQIILLLDSIIDPQNFGALIRTAYAFGINNIFYTKHHSCPITSSVIKASAGTIYYVSMYRLINIRTIINELKKRNFWIYGTHINEGENVRKISYKGNIAIILGNENKGIKPLIKKQCDFLISIPLISDLNSLNVNVAAGIILHQISFQKFSNKLRF